MAEILERELVQGLHNRSYLTSWTQEMASFVPVDSCSRMVFTRDQVRISGGVLSMPSDGII